MPPDARTPAPAGHRVYLETFGCQMNELDSQLVQGQLRALGYRFVADYHHADVVLYNTCSVREHAEQKVYSRIGVLGLHKKEHPEVVLGVIGCMAERDGLDMARRYPQIDVLCGPGELDKLPLLIDNVVKTSLARRGGKKAAQSALQGNTHRRSATLAAVEDRLELLDLSRSFSPDDLSNRSAYVRITRGCNKFCTYCVVPNTRGAEVHRPPDNIVAECRRLIAAGVAEITLIGQTVNHYHYDHRAAVTVAGVQQPQIGRAVVGASVNAQASQIRGCLGVDGNVTTFAQLLARIHDELPTLPRLRFVTSFPRDFGDDILRVMAERPRLCRYLHIPVQSGSNRILKLMNRGYTVEEYRDLLARVRHHLPDVQLASDVICGFPTETEDDHQATAALLRDAGFKNCFIFKYSPRPGTAAISRFEDDVHEATKRRRNHELLAIQSQVSAAVHQAQVGRTLSVLVESISQKVTKQRNAGVGAHVTLGWEPPVTVTQLTGRTAGDLIVCFDGEEALVGQIVEVQIESAAPLTLFGRLR